MEIALIIVALVAAGLGLAAWRLNGRVAGPDPDLRRLEEERDAARTELADAQRELAVAHTALDERSKERDTLRTERGELREVLQTREQALATTTAQLAEISTERNERTIQRDALERERDEARSQLQAVSDQLSAITADLAEAKKELAERSHERDTLQTERDHARLQLAEHDESLTTTAASLAKTTAELTERSDTLETVTTERDHARLQLAERDESLTTTAASLAKTTAELTERSDTLETVTTERDHARLQLAERDESLTTTAASLAKTTAELAERSDTLETVTTERDQARAKLSAAEESLAAKVAELAEIRADHEARQQELTKQQESLDTQFKVIASEVVKSTSEEFRKQAQEDLKHQRQLAAQDLEARQKAVDTVVKPVGESLEKLQKRIQEIEEKREGAYAGLHQQVERLTSEAGGLREALRSPQARGQWGEQTLQNILDLAGMREGVDYFRQAREQIDGATIQPDVVVNLPSNKRMVIDAKTPADSYLTARESSDDDTRNALLQRHADRLLQHARDLHQRQYRLAEESLDFVVMFVAADAILDAALQVRPAIWEETWRDYRVLLASPAVLIALLNGVAVGLQQEKLYENAEEIRRAGQEIYRRLSTYASHVSKVGQRLTSTVNAYNESVGSLEASVLPQARRFEQLGAVSASRSVDEVKQIEVVTRDIRRPELLEPATGSIEESASEPNHPQEPESPQVAERSEQ